MKIVHLSRVLEAVEGRVLAGEARLLQTIDAVCTDSRQMKPRSIFVALRGERFDAHDHVSIAVERGAVAAIVERMPEKVPAGCCLIQVPNTYVALGKIAKLVRAQMTGKVIAVAGSNGKTGTKLLIHSALRMKMRGSPSPKSYNNNVGVPLTIFAADPSQDYLVVEIGTNHPGEIAPLTDMAQPDAAVITNAGAEHLEGLGDLDGVRRENATIIQGLTPNGLLVVNGDDPELVEAVSGYRGERLTFGIGEHNDLFATAIQADESGVQFKLNGAREVSIPLLGRHTAVNSLAAFAIARWMGLSDDEIAEGLAHAVGPDMRLQLQRVGELTILNDAYNANPDSMRAAIETAASLSTRGRRVAVLGDMRELGDTAEQFHREIGEFAANAGELDLLICVGPTAQTTLADAAVDAGMPQESVVRFPDARAAAVGASELLESGDLVLLKASRSIGLEAVATAIVQRTTGLRPVPSV